MKHVIIEDDKIVGVFSGAQPQLEGYQLVEDDDPRFEEFNALQQEMGML